MREASLIGGAHIVFDTDVVEKNRDKVMESDTYLFEDIAIEEIKVVLTRRGKPDIELPVMMWKPYVDEEYFEEEENRCR